MIMNYQGSLRDSLKRPSLIGGSELSNSPIATQTPGVGYREKLIEISANTANGCLSELGYFPGIVEKLYQLNNENILLRNENAKLFADNRELVIWHQRATMEISALRGEMARLGIKVAPGSAVQVGSRSRSTVQRLVSIASPPEMTRRASQPITRQSAYPPNQMNFPQNIPISVPSMSRPGSRHTSISSMPSSMFSGSTGHSSPVVVPDSPEGPPLALLTKHRQNQINSLPIPCAIPNEVIDLTGHENDVMVEERAKKRRRIEEVQRSDMGNLESQVSHMAIGSNVEMPSFNAPIPHNRLPPIIQPPVITDPLPHEQVTGRNAEATAVMEPYEQTVSKIVEPSADTEMPVDEEGLNPVELCLEAAFGEDPEQDGKLWCNMCQFRYMNSKSEATGCLDTPVPIPFINAPQHQLVEHCQKEHPNGWNSLRTAKRSEEEADA